MKKFKNEIFSYFILPSIIGFILLYVSIILIFNYKYRTVVIDRIRQRIPQIKEFVFQNDDRFATRRRGRQNHFRRNMGMMGPMRHMMPILENRAPHMAFMIYSRDGSLLRAIPPSIEKKEFIKINEERLFSEDRSKYLDVFIRKNRIYSQRERDFLRILFIYSFILLLILIGVFFYISNKFSKKILRFFEKVKDKFIYIAKGNYKIEIEADYEEFVPLKKGVENMAELLDKEEKRRREFITNISHDIKTPISIIRANIEGILDDVIKDSKPNLKLILKEVNNLESLIERIKYFDRNDNKNKEWINIHNKLKTYVEKYKNIMDIKLDFFQNLEIKFNEEDFYTIFDNIISNSYKYNRSKDKKVIIKIRRKNNQIKINIIDNGEGIEKKYQKRIFEKFYKQENSRKDRNSMGLGLAIVKRIVNQYDGYIDVESKVGFYTNIGIVFKNIDYK